MLTEDCQNEINVPDKYKADRDGHLQLLFESENILDGHLAHIRTAWCRV